MYHGLKTSYWNFKDYVEEHDKELVEVLETYFSYEDLWSDLEDNLASFDADSLIENAGDFLVSYGAEDWSDAFHHDYSDAIREVVEKLSVRLKELFTEWVLQIDTTPDPLISPLQLDSGAMFLNFNYTDSLEKLYSVPFESITYIHNKAVDQTSDLILGHGHSPASLSRTPKQHPEQSDEDYYDMMADQDTRVTEGDEIINSYFASTYKPTAMVLAQNRDFFDSLSEVTEVHVLGHSLAPVDWPYLKSIVEETSLDCKWRVSYHNPNEVDKRKQTLLGLGLLEEQIIMLPIQYAAR